MVAIIGIIAVIAVPGLLRARMAGSEASAMRSVRAVNSAQSIYAASCDGGRFFGSNRSKRGLVERTLPIGVRCFDWLRDGRALRS